MHKARGADNVLMSAPLASRDAPITTESPHMQGIRVDFPTKRKICGLSLRLQGRCDDAPFTFRTFRFIPARAGNVCKSILQCNWHEVMSQNERNGQVFVYCRAAWCDPQFVVRWLWSTRRHCLASAFQRPVFGNLISGFFAEDAAPCDPDHCTTSKDVFLTHATPIGGRAGVG